MRRFRKLFFIVLFTSVLNVSKGQTPANTDSLIFSAFIIDKTKKDTLSFVSVYNTSKKKGTISNFNGYFTLKNVSLNDTIIFTSIGYIKQSIVIGPKTIKQNIYLEAKQDLLDDVYIYGDNSFLYDLLVSSCKTKYAKSKTAKSYYLLKSSINNQIHEMVETYYNGEYSNYNIDALHYKNGRLALKEFNNGLFISLESSKALQMHKLTEANDYFPISPFELSKKKMKSIYDLRLISKFNNDNQSPVYLITFTPVADSLQYFSGKVWIDSLSSKIVKVELNIQNPKHHPFILTGKSVKLLDINLHLSKTFTINNNEAVLSTFDFNYNFTYKNSQDSIITIDTKAILKAYDFSSAFILPFFNYTNASYGDYMKVGATPYNQYFWDRYNDFRLNDFTQENHLFYTNESSYTNTDFILKTNYYNRGFFEKPYVFWSKNRIIFKEDPEDKNFNTAYSRTMPSDMYKLNAQIYLDIIEHQDTIYYLTKTVFDPYESYYRLPLNKYAYAFINMYFDIVEIHRIELEKELSICKSVEEMKKKYAQINDEMELILTKFFKDVEHGTDENGMKFWNNYLKEKLEIDNYHLFKLDKDDEN